MRGPGVFFAEHGMGMGRNWVPQHFFNGDLDDQ